MDIFEGLNNLRKKLRRFFVEALQVSTEGINLSFSIWHRYSLCLSSDRQNRSMRISPRVCPLRALPLALTVRRLRHLHSLKLHLGSLIFIKRRYTGCKGISEIANCILLLTAKQAIFAKIEIDLAVLFLVLLRICIIGRLQESARGDLSKIEVNHRARPSRQLQCGGILPQFTAPILPVPGSREVKPNRRVLVGTVITQRQREVFLGGCKLGEEKAI